MNEMTTQGETQDAEEQDGAPQATEQWETPKLEDVSEQVMAQPYIRFT
jgi:hypothetical protein